MRFNVACVAVLSAAGIASALPGWFDLEPQVTTFDDGNKVPGDNPLTFCNAEHSDDKITIERVDLTPNPPKAGTPLTINAVGTVLETIEKGAYVNLVVKYGLIRLLNTKADLCEQTSNVELECPIEKGKLTIVKDVDIPKEVPPGTYTVVADVYTADDKPITCLQATVTFGGKTSVGEL